MFDCLHGRFNLRQANHNKEFLFSLLPGPPEKTTTEKKKETAGLIGEENKWWR